MIQKAIRTAKSEMFNNIQMPALCLPYEKMLLKNGMIKQKLVVLKKKVIKIEIGFKEHHSTN